MSPEQALGKEIDARTDIFSLGIVLHELLAGEPPFRGVNVVQVLDAILREDPPPLPASLTDPRRGALQRILRRMMAKDRGQRYASLDEFRRDLDAVRCGRGPVGCARVRARPARVAVIGFANISGSGEDDWLGAGIAETVTADLKLVNGAQRDRPRARRGAAAQAGRRPGACPTISSRCAWDASCACAGWCRADCSVWATGCASRRVLTEARDGRRS